MTVGDLVQGYNNTEEWLPQMEEYRGIMEALAMPWYPVAGNHDVYWRGSDAPPGQHEASYETHFGPLWYWFPHKNAAFIVLYTDEGDRESNRKGFRDKDVIQMSEEQIAWLEETLGRTAGFDHVFVFMHHPRFIETAYRESNWPRVEALLAAAENVTAVFAGHFHRQRYDGIRNGIEFFTLATVGGGLRMDVPGSGYQHHMELVTVRRDRIDVASVPVGQVYDPRALTPEYQEAINKALAMPVALEGQPLTLSHEGLAQGELRYSLENTSDHPMEIRPRRLVTAGRLAGLDRSRACCPGARRTRDLDL